MIVLAVTLRRQWQLAALHECNISWSSKNERGRGYQRWMQPVLSYFKPVFFLISSRGRLLWQLYKSLSAWACCLPHVYFGNEDLIIATKEQEAGDDWVIGQWACSMLCRSTCLDFVGLAALLQRSPSLLLLLLMVEGHFEFTFTFSSWSSCHSLFFSVPLSAAPAGSFH